MSIVQKAFSVAARYLPDAAADPLAHADGYIGAAVDRVDAPLKVTGAARFAAEYTAVGLLHAALVGSRIPRGRITVIDTAAAETAAGVVAVLTHRNMPRLAPPPLFDVADDKTIAPSELPVLQDDRIHWNGQPVAVVIAETLEDAEHAATLVAVEYAPDPEPRIAFDALKAAAIVPKDILGEPPEVRLGDAEAALQTAAAVVDGTYRTPWYNHNALEPHASMALWSDGERLTLHDATQCVNRCQTSLARVLGVDAAAIDVLAPFVGGGFGGKAGLWFNSILCAVAARVVGRPVRLALSRADVYRVVGGRTLAEQRVALGADAEGRLTSLIHTCTTATPEHARYAEQCTFPARHLYAVPALHVAQTVVHLDTVANTWMRAPGESIGTFALESALDELAATLRLDPIELRRRNEPDRDPTTGMPFSTRNLVEAYRRGAERFGWSRRSAEPRGRRDGEWLIGHGVATAYYPALRLPGQARVILHADGMVDIYAAANEMGMGTATAQIQHAAERLGLPLDRIAFHYGDSSLPQSPMAGGSCQTISIAAAVQAAIDRLHQQLVDLARQASLPALAEATVENTVLREGRLVATDAAGQGETLTSILRHAGRDSLDVQAAARAPRESFKYSMASYGAQFCEVRVREDSGEIRVSRWLGAFDCGRIVNPKTAASQLRGGIVMGIGMALSEETLYDDRTGRIVNPSLAEYHVPVNLDVPPIDILTTDIPDELTPIGAHGVGEIGITGVAAAIANAVFNATGRRVRELPITLDKLL